ncbi:hypothetical protein GGR51DRAFT_559236 [Nemania sp. FL0031]|nr:hypothetical protein GGR51DRAFT_559236 [Nemania sp. FL0031]
MAEPSSSRRRRRDSEESRSDDDTNDEDSIMRDAEADSSDEDAEGSRKKSAYFEKNKGKLIEGLEKVPGRLQTQLVKIPDRMVEIDKKGAEAIRLYQPPKTMSDLLGMLQTITFDDIWTQEEDNRFKADHEADPYHQYIVSDEALPRAANHNFWTMWKIIPRLRNCFPTDIIGARVQLKYGTNLDIGGGISKPDLRWSSNFCSHLTQLVLGSPCKFLVSLYHLSHWPQVYVHVFPDKGTRFRDAVT